MNATYAWMDRASCRSHHDPDLWFPPTLSGGIAAIRICRQCPVVASCARYAIDTHRVDGIVAGIRLRGDTHYERDRARLEVIAARHDIPEHDDSTTPHTRGKDDAPGRADPGLPLLVPVSRAATLLGISRAGAYRLVASDQLPTRRMGGRIYVLTSALLRELSG